MFTRKWLMTTTVCSFILAMSGGAQASTMTPEGGWAVSKVETSASGKPYCAVARRFSNNMVWTLAQNVDYESSLALDFRTSTLNNRQDYRVELTTGAGEERVFNIRPVSPQALIVRLGRDNEFIDSLARSGRLSASLSGDRYDYNIPDFADGRRQLQDCLAGLRGGMREVAVASGADVMAPIPVAATAPASSSAQATAPTPQAYEEARSSADSLEQVREENMRLRQALAQERRQYEDRLLQEGTDSSKVAELNEKLRLLEQENRDLRLRRERPAPPPMQCPDVTASDAVSEKRLEQMAAQLSSLRVENARLRDEIEILRAERAETPPAPDMAAPNQQAAQEIERLRQRVSALENDNEALRKSVSERAGDTGGVSLAQLRSIEEQLQQVQAERDKLRQEIDAGVGRAVSEDVPAGGLSSHSIASENWNLEQATRRFNEAEREIRRLGRQLEEQRTHCAAEKRDLEYMLFDPQIATQEQIARLQELEGRVATAEQKYEAQKEQFAALQENKGASSAEQDRLRYVYEQEIADLRTEIDAVTAQAEQARQALALEQQNHEKTVREMEGRLASVQRQADGHAQPYAARRSHESPESREETVASAPLPLRAEPAVYSQAEDAATLRAMPASLPVAGSERPSGTARAHEGRVERYSDSHTAAPSASSLDMARILSGADISVTESVSRVSSVTDRDVYRWRVGSLFGSAEHHPRARTAGFDNRSLAYLSKVEERCSGQFAAVPAVEEQSGDIRIAAYEIACIDATGEGNAASVLFYADPTGFTAIAHEAGLHDMDEAMDARDRLVRSLTRTNIASR